LILSLPGARQKLRRIPRPVFNRLLNRLSQPQTASPYYPIKLRQPIVHMLEYPQKARKWSEDDRRKQSELMRRVHARKAARKGPRGPWNGRRKKPRRARLQKEARFHRLPEGPGRCLLLAGGARTHPRRGAASHQCTRPLRSRPSSEVAPGACNKDLSPVRFINSKRVMPGS
jgi:hypothetical protein